MWERGHTTDSIQNLVLVWNISLFAAPWIVRVETREVAA